MSQRLSGSCLCGACRFTAEPEGDAHVCHCGMCRRFSGGMFMVVDCARSLEFVADALIGCYHSSEWGERLFCRTCGSSLAWRSRDGEMAWVSIQSFEDPARFTLGMQIFVDCKPDNYTLANKTATMTEAEVLAQFAQAEPSTEGYA